MAKKRTNHVVVGARFLHAVDNYLRKKQRGRGDLSALIERALREADLGSVKLITIQGQRRQVTARPTKIVLPKDLRDELDQYAEKRGCSMNELLNSALVTSFFLQSVSEKSVGRLRRRPPPTLSSMTFAERQDFFGRLLSLTGLKPGPDQRSKEGHYYMWDPELGATVEVAVGGTRYLIERVGPGEIVRSRELEDIGFIERVNMVER